MAFYGEEQAEVGGHRLILAIDFSVIDFAEGLIGLDMPEIMKVLSGSPQLGVATRFVYALLRRHHPEISQAMVVGLLAGEERHAISDAVEALLDRAMNVESAGPTSSAKKVSWSVKTFLVEWLELGGTDDRFWAQTPASYVVCMDGMAKAAATRVDLAMITAWHTATIALSGFNGGLRGKKLADFLTRPTEAAPPVSKKAKALAFFISLRSQGIPVEITRH